jgi:hypothetical protein
VGSIDFQSYGLEQAAWRAARIGVGKVLEAGSFRYPGSRNVEAQPEGQSLDFLRVLILSMLKGRGLKAGKDLRIFSAGQWFGHTHASLIRDGVMSYGESHYSGGLTREQIGPGMEILFFLAKERAPAGFPPGSVFTAMEGSLDRGDRADALRTALKEGPFGSFDHRIAMKARGRVRLPDGLEIHLDCHSHKRPMTGGPRCQSTHLTLSKDGTSGTLQLNHVTDPEGSQSWGKGTWGPYTVELYAMTYDHGSEIVVRKA